MKLRSSTSRATTAFTLIELMLALVIGTLILSAAAGVFVTTLDAWHRGSRSWAEKQAADKIAALIERHLRAAVSPAVDNQAVFRGEDLSLDEKQIGHRLTFVSAAPGRFPRNLPMNDIGEVEFEFDPETGAGLEMRIQFPPVDEPDDGGYLVALSVLVTGFKVIYFDGEEWVESWSSSELPKAVEFTLVVQGETDPLQPAPTSGDDGAGPSATIVTRLVWLPTSQTQEDAADASNDNPAGASNGATGGATDGATGGAAGGTTGGAEVAR
jgi:prepilin-type N-terminal cleavage/methylation domain-containing protein